MADRPSARKRGIGSKVVSRTISASAGVAELADARDLGSRGVTPVQVRALSPAFWSARDWRAAEASLQVPALARSGVHDVIGALATGGRAASPRLPPLLALAWMTCGSARDVVGALATRFAFARSGRPPWSESSGAGITWGARSGVDRARGSRRSGDRDKLGALATGGLLKLRFRCPLSLALACMT